MNKLGKFIKYLFNGVLFEMLSNRIRHYQHRRKSVQWESLGEKDFFIKNIYNRVKIKLYKDSKLAKFIFLGGFEEDEQKFISRFLKKGNTFLDIGSNIGLFSIIASAKVEENGKVYAFEPTKKTFSRLTENISINKLTNIVAENLAISNSKGVSEIFVSEDGYDAWNSFGKPTGGADFSKEVVDTVTLDEYVKIEIKSKIDLIKIDVEGWEIPVIQGGENYLKENSPVLIIEFTDENAINAGFSCRNLYKQLIGLGYNLCTYNRKKNRIEIDEIRDFYPYLNLVATKNVDFVNRILAQ